MEVTRRIQWSCIIWAGLSVGGVVALMAVSNVAQVASEQQRFEVASVSLVSGDVPLEFTGGPGSATPGKMRYARVTLGNLIRDAFNVQRYQVEGPNWIDSASYTIQAKYPPTSTMEDFLAMLTNLLIDRFKLAYHRELLRGRGALRLAVSPPRDPTISSSGGGGWEKKAAGGTVKWTFANCDMVCLAGALGRSINGAGPVPIIDHTALAGKFDFAIEYPVTDRYGVQAQMMAALQEQLGLRLASIKAPTAYVIVDHVERQPLPN